MNGSILDKYRPTLVFNGALYLCAESEIKNVCDTEIGTPLADIIVLFSITCSTAKFDNTTEFRSNCIMSELPTFHIRFLFDNNFFTWEELGCLSRALGFPSDLFRRFFQSDVNCVAWNNKGVSSKTFHKMLEQASFHTKLHRSYNMHTSEWNVRVIEQTLNLLGHKALDFDDVYKARVAYTTYEHGDMKGMLLTKNVLLRTLKFCGRVISPMKLMHRVKHMKDQLDERGRIQLYEFFNLILWCDLYTRFDSKQVENSSGKVGDLFKIVDFRRLLSHHDERLANRLNDQYVREERTYGKPALGGSSKFTDPVVHTAPRMIQVQLHNEKYRHLQQEVMESEKRVCQAHAGNIRQRPITAPDLSKYSDTKQLQDDFGMRCQYSRCTDNRRLRSAPARIKSKCPSSMECEASRISNAVSANDVAEVNNKMANLRFDIITLDGRAQLNLDAEINFYLPGYRDRRPSKETAKVTVPESKRKPEHWSTQIIERLTNPTNLKREFHSRCCDAW
ncbi:hypothetical protein Btru_068778 [Bulinus truncatus]|nr:hypothetical protein Btru_068778 [Bulinus truncatus]